MNPAPEAPVSLALENGTTIAVQFRALKVREYPAAFRAYEAEQEWQLIAYSTVEQVPPLKPDWPLDLTPESYETAVAQVTAINSGFFASCGRKVVQRALRDAATRMVAEVGGPGLNASPSSRSRLG